MKEPLLLVDDEAEMLRVLSDIFEHDYEPILAATADEARREMDRRPDCRIAMFDLRMPGSGDQPPEQVGADLIRRFTARADRAAVGFSAERRLESVAKAAGAAVFVTKGVDDEEIAAAVAALPLPPAEKAAPQPDEAEHVRFLTEVDTTPHTASVVVLRNRKVVGSGSTHRAAWESTVTTASQAGEPPPPREDVVFVVVPPDAVNTDSDD